MLKCPTKKSTVINSGAFVLYSLYDIRLKHVFYFVNISKRHVIESPSVLNRRTSVIDRKTREQVN